MRRTHQTFFFFTLAIFSLYSCGKNIIKTSSSSKTEGQSEFNAEAALPRFSLLDDTEIVRYEKQQIPNSFQSSDPTLSESSLVKEDLEYLCGRLLPVHNKPINTCRANLSPGLSNGRFDNARNEQDPAHNWLIECENETSEPRWVKCNYGCKKMTLGEHDICNPVVLPAIENNASVLPPEEEAEEDPATPVVEEMPSSGNGIASPFELVWPVTGKRELNIWRDINTFGGAIAGLGHNHLAADFDLSGNSDLGKPTFAIGPGIITTLYKAGANYRDYIIIKHSLSRPTCKGDQVIYAHYVHTVARADLRVGSVVKTGEIISTVANNNTPYPHLHFEITNKHFNTLLYSGIANGYANEYASGTIRSSMIYFNRSVAGDVVRYYNPSLFIANPKTVFGAPCQ